MGKLVAFILYIQMLFRPIRQLADRFNILQMGMVASERVFRVLDTDELIEDKGSIQVDIIKGDLEFKNVWFAYNDEGVKGYNYVFMILAGFSFIGAFVASRFYKIYSKA